MHNFSIRGRTLHRACVCLTWLGVQALAHAAGVVPSLDPAFGTGGVLVRPFLDMGGSANDVLVQRDGRLVVTGSYVYGYGGRTGSIALSRGVVSRIFADGAPDLPFGNGGTIVPPNVYPTVQQRDGKLVGRVAAGVARIAADGSPDASMTTTGAAGIAWFPNMSGRLLLQSDGRFVVVGTAGVGTAAYTAARFGSDGTLDPTFNYIGAVIAPHGPSSNDYFADGLLQADGRIVASATSTVNGVQMTSVVRLLADGSLDPTFGEGGHVLVGDATGTLVGMAHRLGMQSSGRLLAAGTEYVKGSGATTYARVTALTSAGAVDRTFHGDGTISLDFGPGFSVAQVQTLVVQPDDKLLILFRLAAAITGEASYAVMRLDPDGAPDTAFGLNGLWYPPGFQSVATMALQPDGGLILAGARAGIPRGGEYAVARFTLGPSRAIEFYNAALDHYFVSMNPQEVADLDLGVHRGWGRTGESFQVYGAASAAPSGFVSVCRFYIPPEHGDSHFFTASAEECATVRARMDTDPNYSGYAFESPSAFLVALPDPVTGACAAGTGPVYRLWNRRTDSNHRYVTSEAVKAEMLARGYVAEGFGPQAVAMCAPL